ncbi:mitochondrial ribosomal protein l55 domain-containing protein [Ditylenchus destructor]|nr:mitochondrial ribosomal protein l55 domain-containing protein [Ditylenchus destructor]
MNSLSRIKFGLKPLEIVCAAGMHSSPVHMNAHRCIARNKRQHYTHIKQFWMRLMAADGSTFDARCNEPRVFFQMPLDLNTCDEHLRRMRLAMRKPKAKKEPEGLKEIGEGFVASRYADRWKKK